MKQSKPIFRNDAVSPVVGVMLMLVVTIIIAAVVTAFAGGIVTSQKAAPTLTMNVKISNTGTWLGSGFFATVTGVSTPIPSSDIKIVTSWTATNLTYGNSTISGGAASLPGASNYNFHYNGGTPYIGIAPFAVGPGVGNNESYSQASLDANPTAPEQMLDQFFGNYSVMQGTNLFATPAGAGSMGIIGSNGASNAGGGYGVQGVTSFFNYQTDTIDNKNWVTGDIDPMQAVLGTNWYNLRAGDIVHVQVIHIPSGKVIFNKDVPVTEG
jgi:FlaG/FlaF family flagellin (archaellin)